MTHTLSQSIISPNYSLVGIKRTEALLEVVSGEQKLIITLYFIYKV